LAPLPACDLYLQAGPFVVDLATRFENEFSSGGLGHELCKRRPVEIDEDALPSKDDIKNEIAPEGHQEGRHEGAPVPIRDLLARCGWYARPEVAAQR
jgi:hypothetical protein